MVKTGQLPCNVKFMIEGEEEIGSAHLPDFCRKYKEMLKADVILVFHFSAHLYMSCLCSVIDETDGMRINSNNSSKKRFWFVSMYSFSPFIKISD